MLRAPGRRRAPVIVLVVTLLAAALVVSGLGTTAAQAVSTGPDWPRATAVAARSITAPLGTPTKVTYGGSVSFTVPAKVGQRLTFGITAANLKTSTTTPAHVTIRILNPQAKPWIQPVLAVPANGRRFYEAVRLIDVAGTYTVVLEPQAGTTGTQTVVPNLVTDAPAKAVALGAQQTVKATVPGQNLAYTFSGAAGQKVIASLDSATLTGGSVGGSTKAALRVSLFAPGSQVPDALFLEGGKFGELVLHKTGTWTIVVDPASDTLGTAKIAFRKPVVTTGSLTLGALTTTPRITPGGIHRYTFSGVAGRRFGLDVRNVAIDGNIGGARVRLIRPAGTVFYNGDLSYQQFLESTPLDASGAWTLEFESFLGMAGTFQFYARQSVDVSGTITTDRQITTSLPVPGQRARYTFQGIAGRFPALDSTTITWISQLSGLPAQTEIYLYTPDGRLYGSFDLPYPYPNANSTTKRALLPKFTQGSTDGSLNTSGTWTIEFDPPLNATGSQTFTLRQTTTRSTP